MAKLTSCFFQCFIPQPLLIIALRYLAFLTFSMDLLRHSDYSFSQGCIYIYMYIYMNTPLLNGIDKMLKHMYNVKAYTFIYINHIYAYIINTPLQNGIDTSDASVFMRIFAKCPRALVANCSKEPQTLSACVYLSGFYIAWGYCITFSCSSWVILSSVLTSRWWMLNIPVALFPFVFCKTWMKGIIFKEI